MTKKDRPQNFLQVTWTPGEPLPFALHTFFATGLGGHPQVITPENWIAAMAADAAKRGLIPVIQDMWSATSVLLGNGERIVSFTDNEIKNLMADEQNRGSAAIFQELYLSAVKNNS